MMDWTWINKIPELSKVQARYVAIPVFVSGIILVLPHEALRRLRLDQLVENHGQWIGLVFLVSVGLLGAQLYSWWEVHKQRRDEEARLKEYWQRQIDILDGADKAVIREFFVQERPAIWFPYRSTVVDSLVDRRILEYVGVPRVTRRTRECLTTLSEDARENITLSLLLPPEYQIDDDKDSAIAKEKRQYLAAMRPPFINDPEEGLLDADDFNW